MHPADPNIAMLEAVVTTLGTLADEMVFVGGCAAGLTELAKHLAKRATLLLEDPDFDQALPGLLPPDPGNQARIPRVRERLAAIAGRNG